MATEKVIIEEETVRGKKQVKEKLKKAGFKAKIAATIGLDNTVQINMEGSGEMLAFIIKDLLLQLAKAEPRIVRMALFNYLLEKKEDECRTK